MSNIVPAKVVTGVLTKVPKGPLAMLNPLEFVGRCADYLETCQREKTRRAEIEARRDVAVAYISSQREMAREYFTHRFAERRDVLERLFAVLDQGLADRDYQTLNLAISGVVAVIKDNPLADFQTFQQHLASGATIEI